MKNILAYHLILSAYGFWLPNDPRGSWSDFVRAWELFRCGGPATKTGATRSVAHQPHDAARRRAMKDHLARRPVVFTGVHARAVARGFAGYAHRNGLRVHACAILPDHLHLVVAEHTCAIDQVANLLKGAATTQLNDGNLHPFAHQPYRNGKLPTPWARNHWKCFLFSADDVIRSISYTNDNPAKEGKPRQNWDFISPFTR